MTAAELLKPRFEVILDYPNCPFKVGNILQHHDDSKIWFSNLDDEYSDLITLGIIQEYPHIFKPLNWWEHRKVEDMPKRVISKAYGEGSIYNIEQWDMDNLIGYVSKKDNKVCCLKSWNPIYGYFPID